MSHQEETEADISLAKSNTPRKSKIIFHQTVENDLEKTKLFLDSVDVKDKTKSRPNWIHYTMFDILAVHLPTSCPNHAVNLFCRLLYFIVVDEA